MHVYTYAWMYIRMYACMHVMLTVRYKTYTYVCMYVCCTHVIYVCMHGCMYACMYAVRTYVCMSAHAQAAGRSNKRNLLRNHQPFSWFRSKSKPIGPQSICMYPPPHNRFGLRFSSFSTTQTIVCRSFENFQQNIHFTDVLYWLY